MRPWQKLLGIVGSIEVDPEKYGPHTKQLLSAVVVLQKTRWYGSVGRPAEFDSEVTRVTSWDDVWTVLEPGPRYTSHGMLAAPATVVDGLIYTDEARLAWWRAFRTYFLDVVDIELPPKPKGCASAKAALIIDYPFDLTDHMFKEIIVSDLTDCTYFRQAFQWLAHGYMPCGWDGDWPAGKMRVF